MNANVDVVVVGGGLMGTATAWALARRGHSAMLLEAHTFGHPHGSSHGSARIFRYAYPDPLYVDLAVRAREKWAELEDAAGEQLIRVTGGVDHGPDRHVDQVQAAMARCGVASELLPPAEAMARWPGFRFTDPVLYQADSGVIDADRAVRAMAELAARGGVEVRQESPVLGVEPAGDRVLVHMSTGTLNVSMIVLAAGAWLPGLATDGIPLPTLSVSRQNVFHFGRRDPASAWPTFIHQAGEYHYGLAGGRDGGPGGAIKVGRHFGGRPIDDPDAPATVDPAARAASVSYVERWLPGLDPTPVNEATCLYTSTATEDFVLDRIGQVVVCSPCSGHGAKFAPLLGELAAALATSDSTPVDRFTLAAHGVGWPRPGSGFCQSPQPAGFHSGLGRFPARGVSHAQARVPHTEHSWGGPSWARVRFAAPSASTPTASARTATPSGACRRAASPGTCTRRPPPSRRTRRRGSTRHPRWTTPWGSTRRPGSIHRRGSTHRSSRRRWSTRRPRRTPAFPARAFPVPAFRSPVAIRSRIRDTVRRRRRRRR
jgi:sarcosine oxidase